MESPSDALTIEVIPLEPGSRYVLKAAIRSTEKVKDLRGMVKVHTNNTDQPILEIPVFGEMRSNPAQPFKVQTLER
ncbi:MAG: hypothetical protein HY709_03850 [Candidatus Latescibacteria bacterium]|nr:hypothetical protein [Candidatus Latescibacterota bacterium]